MLAVGEGIEPPKRDRRTGRSRWRTRQDHAAAAHGKHPAERVGRRPGRLLRKGGRLESVGA